MSYLFVFAAGFFTMAGASDWGKGDKTGAVISWVLAATQIMLATL